MVKEKTIIVLDIRGQICPSCLLQTLKAVNTHIDAIRRDECEVHVVSDDRHAMITIPEAVEKMGLTTSMEQAENGFNIHIFKQVKGS